MKSSALRAAAIAAATLMAGVTAHAAGTTDEDLRTASLPRTAPMPEQPAGKWVSSKDLQNASAKTCSMDGMIMAGTVDKRTLVIVKQTDGSLPEVRFGGMSGKEIEKFKEQNKRYVETMRALADACTTLMWQAKEKPVGTFQIGRDVIDVTDKETFPVDFPVPPDEQDASDQIKQTNAPSP